MMTAGANSAASSKLGAGTWCSGPAELPLQPYVLGLAVSPTNSRVIVAGVEVGAVGRSEDGGVHGQGTARGSARLHPKGSEGEETLRAIRAVAHNEAGFSSAVAQPMISFFAHSTSVTSEVAFPMLAEREREVLALMAHGLTNSASAERLVLSPRTVRHYVSNIINKLQLADRAAAIIRAREAGMG